MRRHDSDTDIQVSAPGSTFLGTLCSEAWEQQRVRQREGGHFTNLQKFRVWGGPNKLSEVSVCACYSIYRYCFIGMMKQQINEFGAAS